MEAGLCSIGCIVSKIEDDEACGSSRNDNSVGAVQQQLVEIQPSQPGTRQKRRRHTAHLTQAGTLRLREGD
ncbi:hypothetical protein VP1G_11141 [Cytospora mali]|uniref:Uncharacterized protein n=1 Tax=Cytospora mali TaxID=578113 RepID=A0A194V6U1_CYTMA|nr:hypothetical protein VP1G_11141 [Valsa mali var. pyri (nom. inval.)]